MATVEWFVYPYVYFTQGENMPVPVRRPAAAAAEPINFLSPDFYSGIGTIPEGNYALFFDLMMHRFVKKDGTPGRGPELLKVRVSAYDLTAPDAEPKLAFFSLGKTAHLSYQPNPETGKSLVAVPGGPGGTLPKGTNWDIFLESLWASGMPKTIAQNDLSVLDGLWAHIVQVDEPESRKDIGKNRAKTGAAAIEGAGEAEEEYRPAKIPVVSEILEGGAPWEGGGGLPEAAAPVSAPKKVAPIRPGVAAPKATVAAPVARPPVRSTPKPAPAPVAQTAELTEEDLATGVSNAISAYFEKNSTGGTGVLLKTQVFKHVEEAMGADAAQAVIDTYFSDDATLNSILGEFGYVKTGVQIKLKG